MKLGSGESGELTFLDIIAIMGFLVGLENLGMNVTQEDAQALQQKTDANAKLILDEIHKHLKQQDLKLDAIIQRLEDTDETK